MLSSEMEWQQQELLNSIKRLAAAPEEQEAYIRSLGSSPSLDELALEFDDMFGPSGTDPPAGPEEWQDALRRLDSLLTRMSGTANARLWVVDALSEPEWAEVRSVARQALAARFQSKPD